MDSKTIDKLWKEKQAKVAFAMQLEISEIRRKYAKELNRYADKLRKMQDEKN